MPAQHSHFGVMLGIQGLASFGNTTDVTIMEWNCADEYHSHFGVAIGILALDLKFCRVVSYLHKGL